VGRENGGSGESEMDLRVLKIPKIWWCIVWGKSEDGEWDMKDTFLVLAYAASTVMMLYMM